MTIAEKFQTIAENTPKVYESGKKVGYNEGHKQGKIDGRQDGYETGRTEGYKNGYNAGYGDGEMNGRNAGYDDGYIAGNDAGFDGGYAAGRNDERNEFWDGVTDNGERTNYTMAFVNWGVEYIRPNRKIIPTTANSGCQTFNACRKLKKIEAAYFDFSQKPRAEKTQDSYYFTMYNCHELEEVEDIGLQAEFTYDTTFANDTKLHTIAKIRCDENTKFNNAFIRCSALKHLIVEGVIGQNGFNVAWAPLTHESLMSILNALKDYSNDTSGTEWICYIGANNLAKLTADERKIAETKGWSLQ